MYNEGYYCLHYTLTITIYVLNSCTAIVLIVIDYILCVIKIVIIIKAIYCKTINVSGYFI